ncbi:MAG: corrinoid protein [Deltaproteobacteria bacterium]|jgi:5-methyltetrahydrofolate--homocysteine methyltransferase|nr:corrinoid protein [Deltaproteobacteria bacterium]
MSIKEVYQAVVDFNEDDITDLVEKELEKGTDIQKVLQEGLISAMDYVGKQFSEGELFVPEMLMAAQTMKKGLEILKPKLGTSGGSSAGTIIIGTVKGDLHDIGKNLVGMMLEGGGFEIVDLGVDVEPKAFVEAAKTNKAKIVGLSALLTTTMPAMEETIKALKEAGLSVKTMVGGAPVTKAFADKIGATGYSEDAPGAVELARKLAS